MTAFETEQLTLNQQPFLHSSRDYAVHILIQVLLPVLLQILVPVQNLTQYQIISSSVLVGRTGSSVVAESLGAMQNCDGMPPSLIASSYFSGYGFRYGSVTA